MHFIKKWGFPLQELIKGCVSMFIGIYLWKCVWLSEICHNFKHLWTMFLCIEFHFDEMSRKIWGSKSKMFKTWNIVIPIDDEIKATMAAIKMIFWVHFHKLRYAHYKLSVVSIIAMQSVKTVAPIEKAGETMKVW